MTDHSGPPQPGPPHPGPPHPGPPHPGPPNRKRERAGHEPPNPEGLVRKSSDLDIEAFMGALLKGTSGVEAIQAAGYRGDGAKAARAAYKLRNTKWVREELRARHDELMRRAELPTDDTIEHELAAISFGDYTVEVRLKALTQLVKIRGLYREKPPAETYSEKELLAKAHSLYLMQHDSGARAPPPAPESEDAQQQEARTAAARRARTTKELHP